MNRYWNFPATTGGLINSINNAGLETFRGNALDSLTREICQNSLDAVKDKSKPVLVEFKSFSADSTSFPNKEELVDVFHQCKETWHGRNKKSEDFIENALKLFNQQQIQFLRISDFNTKGLEGAKEGEIGSPWSTLVKEAGSSNKDESSGGSFGIGKSAPFLNSNLRTLFYASLDISGYKSYIGVANIMSFKKNNDQITLGNGYFTFDERSLAIPGDIILDQDFTREETGTDIYIAGFQPKGNWKGEVTKSVLVNFFITVYNKKLVVKINDFEINHENIGELIAELDDSEENRVLKNYFNLLISDKTIKIKYPAREYKNGIHFEEGEAELYLLNGEDLNRRVLMTRKTGMMIFEQKNISGSISFTGLLMITGAHMNNVFKQMENPAHNEWSSERYEKDPKLAKKIYGDLKSFIRNTVKEYFQEKITDSMDAVGLNDFLPNKNLLADSGTKKRESLNSTIKSIITKEVKEDRKKRAQTKGQDRHEDLDQELEGNYGITPTGDEGGGGAANDSDGGDAGGSTTEPGGQNEVNPQTDGDKDKKKERKPSKHPVQIQQKYASIDKNQGKYKFFISQKKSLENGKLVFKVMGEQSNYDLPIKNASTDDKDVTVEKVSSNTVYVQSIKANKSFMINVEIDYFDYCVLEVELYEN
ncbi:hypothetical protein [Alkalihalobacterium sp. APHAB7]|uniref:hypothetical protein n=1 Tax=Alkalihalobacterium sp. APHAB7 TaxID=3402081 RepID=UPI003AAEE412